MSLTYSDLVEAMPMIFPISQEMSYALLRPLQSSHGFLEPVDVPEGKPLAFILTEYHKMTVEEVYRLYPVKGQE